MNHFVAGIIKIILLEGSLALLLIDRLVEGKWEKQRLWGARILTLLMVFAWCNFGLLRGNFGMVHEWEQFHFYLGAKYQQEVGWFNLYKAAILADRESTHTLDRMTQTRDITNFEVISVDQAMKDGPQVRAKFSDARWAEFKEDWRRMQISSPGIGFDRIMMDHGNSNSPAWALIAHPIAELFPIDRSNQTFIGLLDMFLMGIMWWFIWRSFGPRPTLVAVLIWAALPIVFDYLAGSFLRWDWLFCLGMAIVFMKREKWATAGAFFGFAVATKLFPVFFGVALGIRALLVYQREKKLAVRYRRFAVGAFASALTAVLLSSAMFGGFWAWKEYKQRIDVARDEKFYSIQYSLQTVYLQFTNSSAEELVKGGWLFPAEIKQARADVDINAQSSGFFLIKLLFTLLVVVLILRADDIQAFTLGPLLVLIWLIVNMYYWNMLGFLALGLFLRKERPALGALLGLHFILIVYYLYVHLNRGFSEGYAVAVMLCVWLITFAAFEWRELKGQFAGLIGLRPPASAPPPARAP